MDNATSQEKDNATSRKEVEIAVENAFYVIKHYCYTLLNDNAEREKNEQDRELPQTACNFDQAKEQLESNRNQQKPIEELLDHAEKLKARLDQGDITYRKNCEPFSD